ncbi:rhodanese-like domain-containing protein [Candidatus Babeliales bacterium]|nr:rhodanese-like domain-containing protein [Candidatus Babeliales bacterium]
MSHTKKHSPVPIVSMSATQLKEKIDQLPDLTIINVLNEETYVDCHIPGSINVPYDRLIETLAGWEKDKEIVVYCAQNSCSKSKEAYELLADLGFTHLSEYSGGMKDWLKKGYDTIGICTMRYLHE